MRLHSFLFLIVGCPALDSMPVFHPDTMRFERMPVVRPEMKRVARMPVVRPRCDTLNAPIARFGWGADRLNDQLGTSVLFTANLTSAGTKAFLLLYATKPLHP